MTDDQIQLVQRSFALIDARADAVAARFYERLFALDPALRALFTGDLAAQGRKLMAALRLVVRGLHDLPALLPSVQALGARHTAYGVQPAHYGLVGAALIGTLADTLGEAFTPEVRASWQAAYGALATAMQGAAPDVTPTGVPRVGLH